MSRENVLVTPDWAEQNLNTDGIVFVEVDEDTTAYDAGHIPGAVKITWKTELQDPVIRAFVDQGAVEKAIALMQEYREKVRQDHPNAGFGEIGKLLGKKWKDMSEKEKIPYVNKAEEDKKRYEKEKAAMEESKAAASDQDDAEMYKMIINIKPKKGCKGPPFSAFRMDEKGQPCLLHHDSATNEPILTPFSEIQKRVAEHRANSAKKIQQ